MNTKVKLKYFYFNRFGHFGYGLLNRVKNHIYINSIPLNKQEKCTPFFIVGSGRSGNTLLRRIINSKNGIVIPPETYVLGKIIGQLHNAHKNMEWEEYVNLIVSTFEYHRRFYTFEIDSLSELALKLKDTEEEKRSLAYIIDQFYIFYAHKLGRNMDRWGDKTPANSIHVYQIKKLFPKAQFIHIIRDGVDVVNSYVNAGIYDEHATAALRWKGSIEFLRKFGQKNSDSYFEIKYEELVTNPEIATRNICGFLGITFDPQMLSSKDNSLGLGDVDHHHHHTNVRNDINMKSIGKGRKELSEKILNDIKKEINPLLIKLGYESL